MSLLSEVETVAGGATGTWWIKLVPYGLAAAGTLALLYGAYSWAYHRGVHSRDAEVAALNGTLANMKAASAKATADNVAHVQAVEAQDAAIQKEQSDALSSQLADARAVAANYASLHHPTADQGDAGNGGLSKATPATSAASSASTEAVVPSSDLDACAQAYVVATGWQAWWQKVSAVPSSNQ